MSPISPEHILVKERKRYTDAHFNHGARYLLPEYIKAAIAKQDVHVSTDKYATTVDIWSIGITIWELYLGAYPILIPNDMNLIWYQSTRYQSTRVFGMKKLFLVASTKSLTLPSSTSLRSASLNSRRSLIAILGELRWMYQKDSVDSVCNKVLEEWSAVIKAMPLGQKKWQKRS
nr:mitogen-activated protein kinase kinase 4-like [Ipomoea batatas]